MLSDRESSERHLDSTRRHIRLCKQVKGAEQLAANIEPAYRDLLQKQAATRAKLEAREDAHDDAVLRDGELDDAVRTAFERTKQFDRENPGAQLLLKIFPQGRFSDITRTERAKEPDVVEEVAMRIASLGENHPLNPIAADLRAKIEAARASNAAFLEAIRNQKLAEAEEEIAQANLRRQYEFNYLDARKTLGRAVAERLFPQISVSEPPEEPEQPPETGAAGR
jgi:hypothetical protein